MTNEKDRKEMVNELARVAFEFGEKHNLTSMQILAALMGTILSICREWEISPELVAMMMEINKNVYARRKNDKS